MRRLATLLLGSCLALAGCPQPTPPVVESAPAPTASPTTPSPSQSSTPGTKLVELDHDLKGVIEWTVSAPAPKIEVGPSDSGGGSGSFSFGDEPSLVDHLPEIAADAEFSLSKEGVLTIEASEEAHEAIRAWLSELRAKGETIALPPPE